MDVFLSGDWGYVMLRNSVKDIFYVTYAISPYETDYFNPKYVVLLKLNNYFLCFNITNHRFSSMIYNLHWLRKEKPFSR